MKRLASPITGRMQSPDEMAGKEALYLYFRKYHGRQAELARATGIKTAVLSKMAGEPPYIITLDAAMLIELATKGELRADVLCPSRAGLMANWLAARAQELAQA